LPSHGHSETAAQLQGLEILPLKSIEYKNRAFKEFDLDAALARKPGLLLVDELAIGKPVRLPSLGPLKTAIKPIKKIHRPVRQNTTSPVLI